MRLIEQFQAILFDVHGVLMFGHDRFGDDQDYDRTYRAVGGRALSGEQVVTAVTRCFAGLLADYESPARYDDFLSVHEGLRIYGGAPEEELERLTLVFALHECGLVADTAAELLSRLARTHRLGVVSDVWAPKHFWLREFERAGISDLFQALVFSSDRRRIKPSPELFREALARVGVEPARVLFVGDSLRHDMEGAKRVGMRTAWVTEAGRTSDAVDYVISSVLELEQMQA